MASEPKIFRVMLQVSDLEKAVAFYSELLGIKGRVLRGSRAYFDCGPVILAILDPTSGDETPQSIPENLYISVANLKDVHGRAAKLGCLSSEMVHGESAGEIKRRPWGEISFYVTDPWGNGICFADETTLYTGH